MTYWAFGSCLFVLFPFSELLFEPLLRKTAVPWCVHVARRLFREVTGIQSRVGWRACYSGRMLRARIGTMLFRQQRRLLIPFLTGVLTGISTVTYVFMNHSACRSERYGEPLYGNTSGLPKVFCWITTTPSNLIKAMAVKRTWASQCDRYLFISSEQNSDLPSVAAVPLEGRHLLWNKTKFALTHISKYFGDQYDYFYKADDDTYAFVDNLKRLLRRFNPETPLLFGQVHMAVVPHGYPSGGAGYVMSRTALRLIVNGFVNVAMCQNDEYIANEDVKDPDSIGRGIGKSRCVSCFQVTCAVEVVSACANALGIPLIDSRDTNGQRHFFSESPFKVMASKGMKAGFRFLHPDKPTDCCAENPISFHYIEPHEIYFLDYLVHTACSPPTA
ncbi:hypothetical protein P879_07322 [Paragonimus westermani]|uniref:N-acetylgalactosaminide beta-1,3-galactosyltransferase n=1 Tax=Paragonimus westermani TaxID=34504 RepID=A0A8T0DIG8_9TREM|nr:hypothetical protein P879_07322 [Paragonimus westermani]